MKLLSILICSLHERAAMLSALLANLELQDCPEIEILIDVDNGETTIGAKRNRLLDRAQGEYVCFIDDDDHVPPDYVSAILKALATRPDCVGFRLMFYQNGLHRGDAIHSLRFERYDQHRGRNRMWTYDRTPNHLNPIKREIVQQVRFPEINRSEDTDFATRIRPLLKTEVFVDQVLYHYLYRSKK